MTGYLQWKITDHMQSYHSGGGPAGEVQLPGRARLAMGGGQVAEQHHQEHGSPSALAWGG